MNSIEKTAQRLRKEIKNQMSLEDIIRYLKSLGYSVVFYGEHHELLTQYDLTEYSKTVNAFTFCDDDLDIVFINESVSEDDKIYSVLHELSHIELGHVRKRAALRNKRKEEMEAEVLAYNIITPPKRGLVKFLPFVVFVCIMLFFGAISQKSNQAVHNSMSEEYVYLVPEGDKFHRETCIHIQSKVNARITKNQAEKIYQPCKICNP